MENNWRPSRGWERTAHAFTKGSPECRAYYEAGANEMHRADIQWLKENNHGGSVLMISAEKWQALLKEIG